MKIQIPFLKVPYFFVIVLLITSSQFGYDIDWDVDVLLLITIFLTSLYLAARAIYIKRYFWAWVMGSVGIFFNPIIRIVNPYDLSWSQWCVGLCAIYICAGIYLSDLINLKPKAVLFFKKHTKKIKMGITIFIIGTCFGLWGAYKIKTLHENEEKTARMAIEKINDMRTASMESINCPKIDYLLSSKHMIPLTKDERENVIGVPIIPFDGGLPEGLSFEDTQKYLKGILIRGILSAKDGNTAEAIEDITLVIKKGTLDIVSIASYLRGVIYSQFGNSQKAIADYSNAIRLNRAYGEAYFRRALEYYMLADYDKSFDDIINAERLGSSIGATDIQQVKESIALGQRKEKQKKGIISMGLYKAIIGGLAAIPFAIVLVIIENIRRKKKER